MKFKLPKKQNISEKRTQHKTKKEKDSRPLKQRIKDSVSSGFRSIGDFIQYNKKNLLVYGLFYIGLSLLSLFLTGCQDGGMREMPVYALQYTAKNYSTVALYTARFYLRVSPYDIRRRGDSMADMAAGRNRMSDFMDPFDCHRRFDRGRYDVLF